MLDIDDLLGGPATDEPHNLTVALRLAANGFPVFPCRVESVTIDGKLYKEKSPLIPKGFKGATIKEAQIRRWWGKWPLALVGMPTGAATGTAVLDLDRHKASEDGVKALRAMGFDPKDLTPIRTKTAGNGFHLWFRWREGITNSDRHLPKGIDVRAEGGFVIAPGSRFPDGRCWRETDLLQPLPEFPEELMPPEPIDRAAGETGDAHRLDLSLDDISLYLDDLPNDSSVGRQEWVSIMAALHHEATAPNEKGEYRSKADQETICRLAVAWTAMHPDYSTEKHLRQARQDFWSFRTNPHKKLATFRSIAKQVIAIRREIALEEALNGFDDEGDDLGAQDEDGFEDEVGGSEIDDLLGGEPIVWPKSDKPKVKRKRPEIWQEPAAPKYIKLLNKKHALVRFNAKTYVVDFADKDSGEIFSLGVEMSLHVSYAPNVEKMTVLDAKGKPVEKDFTWSQLWIKSEFRRYYDRGITFNPQEDERGKLNLWRGLSLEPSTEGCCDLLLNHIEKILCYGDTKIFGVFMDFIAHMVQRPWERPTFSIVMRGEMGAGKDTVFRYLGEIFGPHYITVGRNSDVSGRFNSHLLGKILVHLQEGFYAGNREQQNYMKFLLDSPKINIERKGVDIFSTRAYHRTIISSNESWVAPVSWGERRYLVLDVDNTFAYGTTDETQRRNKYHFDAIDNQMRKQGGLAKFLHILLTRDISNFDIRRPPKTEGLARQLAEGFRNVDRWWKECLDAGNIESHENTNSPTRAAWERDWITRPTDDLYESYDRWRTRQRHLGDSVTRTKFARDLTRLCPQAQSKQLRLGGARDRVRVTILPTLGTCRREMERLAGGKLDWADEVEDAEILDEKPGDDLG